VAVGEWGLRDRTALTTIHMKRKNLVLNEDLLEQAVRLSGERTYSRGVGRALEDYVRWIRAGRILELAGSRLWEGDLTEMRRDRKGPGGRRAGRAPR
jgi:Arc/MetJ family transcription regulator